MKPIVLAAVVLCLVGCGGSGSGGNLDGTGTVVTPTVRYLTQTALDIAYNRANGHLYASVPGQARSHANSVIEIDPTVPQIVRSTKVGSQPDQIAISDDGSRLYVVLRGEGAVQQLSLPSLSLGPKILLGPAPGGGNFGVTDMAVVPGSSTGLVVTAVGGEPLQTRGLYVYDDGHSRPNFTVNTRESTEITFAGGTLYGISAIAPGASYTVDAHGVSVAGSLTSLTYSRLLGNNGLIFESTGPVIDPASNSMVGTLPHANLSFSISTDGKTLFSPAFAIFPLGIGVYSYNTSTFAYQGRYSPPLDSIASKLGGVMASAGYGTNGVALVTASSASQSGYIICLDNPVE